MPGVRTADGDTALCQYRQDNTKFEVKQERKVKVTEGMPIAPKTPDPQCKRIKVEINIQKVDEQSQHDFPAPSPSFDTHK